MLVGSQRDRWAGAYGSEAICPERRVPVPDAIRETLITHVCHTGRGRLKLDASDDEMPVLKWDAGPPGNCGSNPMAMPATDIS